MIRERFLERFSWTGLLLWVLRVAVIVLILWGSYNTLNSGRYSASTWVTLIVSGLAQGSIYALIALGYSLVYGILFMTGLRENVTLCQEQTILTQLGPKIARSLRF